MNRIESGNLNSVQLFNVFSEKYYTEEFITTIMGQKKITYIIVEESPFNKNIENKIIFINRKLEITFKKDVKQFITNLLLYSESLGYNTYLNRKLHIGSKGEIKNAPECDEIHGNIKEINKPQQIIRIINSADFQKYWKVHKELIDVCKNCEFRHICTDNRIPQQRKDGTWFHKIECNYNPFITRWEYEKGYASLNDSGVISNDRGLFINQSKLQRIS
ncbi:MAG: hypothetical protein JW894_08595 [Bacteroidales bacterium]|nr:hypothetical protein [Bacteroidales bacterium]